MATGASVCIDKDITAAINRAIDQHKEACIKQAVADFEQSLRDHVALIALGVASNYNLANDGRELRITVKLDR